MSESKAVFPARFHLLLFAVLVATFLVHEFAHWATGIALGHDMVATLNAVSPVGPVSRQHLLLIAAAGPLVTIAQGLAGFWWVRRARSHAGFALLYSAFFMRLLAAGVSVFNPNDEAKISQLLGLGPWTLPALVVGGLFWLVVRASRTLRLTLRDQLLCYVVASIAVTLVIGVDRVLWPKA